MQIAFLRRVIQTDHGYEWPRTKSNREIYGVVSYTENGKRKLIKAHRVAWILEKGPIPKGYDIDHDLNCPKTCVTVEHLQCISHSEHSKLGWIRGELKSNIKQDKIETPRSNLSWQFEQSCPMCDISFIPNTPNRKFCSEICKNRAKDKRRLAIRHPKQDNRFCEWCLQEFKPKRVDSNHCSNKCIFDHNNDKRKRQQVELICKECENSFESRPNTIFCSQKCGATYRDQRRKITCENIVLKEGEVEKSNGWIPPKVST